jgi:hypothetical protein
MHDGNLELGDYLAERTFFFFETIQMYYQLAKFYSQVRHEKDVRPSPPQKLARFQFSPQNGNQYLF